MPRMPWANSSPLMRLTCAVLSVTSRLRSRWERRRSSSSTLGMRTTDQTCRSPPTPGDQRTQQLAEVNPIGLCSTAAPIDLHARRVNHQALDAMRFQEAREPKGVVARLVAEYDRWLPATRLRPAITGHD